MATKKTKKKSAKKAAAKTKAAKPKVETLETDPVETDPVENDPVENDLLPEILVKREKANFVTINFIGDKAVRVNPGITRITDQEILECIENPKYNRNWLQFIDQGIHTLITGEEITGGNKTTVFTAMSNNDSIALVKNNYSIPDLERMHADESTKRARRTVLNAIEDQIKEMKTPDPKQKAA